MHNIVYIILLPSFTYSSTVLTIGQSVYFVGMGFDLPFLFVNLDSYIKLTFSSLLIVIIS